MDSLIYVLVIKVFYSVQVIWSVWGTVQDKLILMLIQSIGIQWEIVSVMLDSHGDLMIQNVWESALNNLLNMVIKPTHLILKNVFVIMVLFGDQQTANVWETVRGKLTVMPLVSVQMISVSVLVILLLFRWSWMEMCKKMHSKLIRC